MVTTTVTTTTKAQIAGELQRLETERGIRVLYACESGSRAWGFPSPDSDFDVRILYSHPLDWYLTVDPGRDSLELPLTSELDISGWELRKTLGLIVKSNPVVWEWLQSPICYREQAGFARSLLAAAQPFFSRRSAFFHYLSMARRGIDERVPGEPVRSKKYFYILRPLLAAYWVCVRPEVPPMTLEGLLGALAADDPARPAIADLVRRKATLQEKETVDPIPAIDDLISRLLEAAEPVGPGLPIGSGSRAELDAFLRATVLGEGAAAGPRGAKP